MGRALLTDLYELTMMQGYFFHKLNPYVVFDMFFRRQTFNGGFAVFAGLEDILKTLSTLRFTEEDITYLDSLKLFKKEFLLFLKDFRFTGQVYSMEEGTLVFPNEPLVRIHAPLIEAQLIESFLLNTINFQTLIATKTARIFLATGQGIILEFGLRRAHGPDGALSASRASYIGGAAATSNVMAGKMLGIPVKGTMAHSWIMAFPGELESFEKYAEVFPSNSILLVDTYDTLESGIQNAIKVGLKLKSKGYEGFGVRLDSGDLEYLSKRARLMLDKAGLKSAKIAVSNELDEEIIQELRMKSSPIDIWGVGTNLVTGSGDPSLTGVYKLVAKKINNQYEPAIKVSDNPIKITNPGIKQVYRFYDKEDGPLADLLALEEEEIVEGRTYHFYHPIFDYKHMELKEYSYIEPLLSLKLDNGKITGANPSLIDIQNRAKENLKRLDSTYRRLKNPHVYKVSLSGKVKELKDRLIKKMTG
jgi:nicotinate phosphoribosyltransferase